MTRSFTYGASGNVTLDDLGGSGTVLTYNSLDRLVRVSAGAVTLVDYVYAATGQRAIKTTPTATTHYLYDPGGAFVEGGWSGGTYPLRGPAGAMGRASKIRSLIPWPSRRPASSGGQSR